MSLRLRMRFVARNRSLWVAAGSASLMLALMFAIVSRETWRARAAELQRENMSVQLQELAHELSVESDQLIDRAHDLAESNAVLQLLQDNWESADRAALTSGAWRDVDAFALLNAARTLRLSAVITDGRFVEQPPPAGLLQFVESGSPFALRTPEESQARAAAILGFTGNQLLVARPVFARTPPVSVLGWVVVARTISPAMIMRLAHRVNGSVAAHPLRDFEPSTLPDDLRESLAVTSPDDIETAKHFNVTTHLSADRSAGYVAVRDASGRPVWLLRFTPKSIPFAVASATTFRAPEAAERSYFLGAAGVVLAVTLLALFAVRRYLRHHKSIDARYKALIDQANDGIVIVDAKSRRVLYTNPAFLDRLGYTTAEALTLSLSDIFADGEATPESVLARLQDENSPMALNLQQRCKNGALIDSEVRRNALDVDGRDVLAFVTHDVSLRRKAEQQLIENQQRLDRMAHHDQLTGLPNRHYLAAFLPEAIAEARAGSTMLGVVFLDLDRFKHINDTRGHETGDKLLQEVANRLRACVRESDVVIRMGGDEFVVIFRHVKSYDEVTLGSARIIETLNRPIIIDQHPLQTTGSVGVSLFPRDGSDMVELLKHSDTAMYQAKERGRNNVQMFSQVMNRKLKHRVAVEASLREALRLKQLDVHFQPFINLQTRKVVGLEALMRWRHPVHGMIPADQFIPVAEETGLIVPMGNFVLHRTLQTMSAWRKAGVALVPVSLNVAPAQLQRGELQSTITTLLKSHGLRPEMLQLEMTERAVFDSQASPGENRQDTMAKLRDLGIKIAIDDFGTGYSSLSYLKHWRVDALKIDRSFVRDLVTDSSDLAIVSAIIAIARHLHIQVIAEGIEAYQQAEILRRLGCTVGQGFLFARPMPADECLQYLASSSDTPKVEEEDMLAVFSAGHS